MAIQREITVKLANSPGTLSRVAQLLGAARINMLAMSVDPSGQLRMVVDNPLHAAGALREQHYNVEERDVLYTAMPNEPGRTASLEFLSRLGSRSLPVILPTLAPAELAGALARGWSMERPRQDSNLRPAD